MEGTLFVSSIIEPKHFEARNFSYIPPIVTLKPGETITMYVIIPPEQPDESPGVFQRWELSN